MAKIVNGVKDVIVGADTLIIKDSEDNDNLKEIKVGNLTIDRAELTSSAGLIDTYTLYADPGITRVLGTFDVTNGLDGGMETIASSTNDRVAIWDGTTGSILKVSPVSINSSGNINTAGTLYVGDLTTLWGGVTCNGWISINGAATIKGGVYGDTVAGANLMLESTSHATKGEVRFAGDLVPSSGGAYDIGAEDNRIGTVYTGQTFSPLVRGGDGDGYNLVLQSTSHGNKGKINFGFDSSYDEANLSLGIGTQVPSESLDVVGNALVSGTLGINSTSPSSVLTGKSNTTRLLSGVSSITYNTPFVTGANTVYGSELEVGDRIILDNQVYEVQTIETDLAFTVSTNAQATATNLPMYTNNDLIELYTQDGTLAFYVDEFGNTEVEGKLQALGQAVFAQETIILGNLGIGAPDPEQALHIKKGVGAPVRFMVENTNTDSASQAGWELKQGSFSWVQYVLQSKGNVLNFWSTTLGNDVMTLDATGDITMIADLDVGEKITADRVSVTPANGTEIGVEVIANSLITGNAVKVSSSSGNSTARTLVDIHNDNSNSTGTTALKVTQDSTGLAVDVVGDVKVDGFTQLGDAAIKMKKLTGTTGSTEGDTTVIPHGITSTKLLSYDVHIQYTTGAGMHEEYQGAVEYEYATHFDNVNIIINLKNGNSGNLLSKAITVLLIYEE